MALITGFKPKQREKYKTHGPIGADYYVLQRDGKTHLIQIDTKGSNDREKPNKQSQTIQLDRKSGKELYAILKEAFSFD